MAVYHAGMHAIFNVQPSVIDLWDSGSSSPAGVDGDFEVLAVVNPFTQVQTDVDVADLAGDEVPFPTTPNYDRIDLTAVNRTITAVPDQTRFDAGNVTWSAIGGPSGPHATIDGVVVFRDTGTDATSLLMCYSPFPTSVTTNGGDLTVNWGATGIFVLEATP